MTTFGDGVERIICIFLYRFDLIYGAIAYRVGREDVERDKGLAECRMYVCIRILFEEE